MSSTDARRHDRAWLDPATWRSALRSPLDEADAARIDRWVRLERALVVRRREPGMAADAMPLAVALPSVEDRRRIAVVVDRRAIARVAPPLRLDEVIAAAPATRRAALRALAEGAATTGTTLHVYGSHAWQAICGEDCVTSTSDVDVVWDARDAAQVAATIAMLEDWQRRHGIAVDGEVRFADGAALAWRELSASTARVLVKRDDRVALEHVPALP